MQEAAAAIPQSHATMLRLARVFFKPLARIFLRHGMNYHELKAVLGWSLVHTALKDPEFAIPGRGIFRHTVSHAAAMTGMTRREATQYANMPEPDIRPISERTQRAMRLLFAWNNEPGYQDDEGRPLTLPMRGPAPSFAALAETERRDVPARALADILVAAGNAEWQGKSLRMLSPVHVADSDTDEGSAILAQIATDFLNTLDRELDASGENPGSFREAYFSDIDADAIDDLKRELDREITAFSARCNDVLRRYRKVNGQYRVRAGAGAYSFFAAPEIINTRK